jgi:hypothetical protein
LPNKDRGGDPVLWACDVAQAVSKFDEGILQESCQQIVRNHKWCPSISEIVDWCETMEWEIGGQTTMGVEMARMYAWNKEMKDVNVIGAGKSAGDRCPANRAADCVPVFRRMVGRWRSST